jgi:large subunit ribosomal protein L23
MTVKSNGRSIRTEGFAKSKKRAIITLIDGYNIDLFNI